MTRLIEIRGHIASMDELLDVIGAMRSLASMRVQEAQRALPGIRRYADFVAAALGAALLLRPEAEHPTRAQQGGKALVVFAGEHGFAGGFNDRLLDAAAAALAPSDPLFVLGSRGAAIALQRGRQPAWHGPMATRLTSVPETLRQLEAPLYRRIVTGELARIDMLYARYRPGETAELRQEALLPLDLRALAGRPTAQPPLHNLEPERLLEGLTAEYVFALLTAAAVETMASENAARFAAMEAAHGNVETKLQRLQQEANQARQAEITEELMDLITGARTLSGG
ncbi:MAG TPA: F0F1 ATP synthase subunit gamma [Acetobacteraceae bacterium]|nr:F0F1 ATP synthase subunit gamma [Acetobacteraceae bacterium]